MVTIASAFDAQKEIYCLSTDTKPDDMPNGSICVEMDTGKLYLYDEEGTQWVEFGA